MAMQASMLPAFVRATAHERRNNNNAWFAATLRPLQPGFYQTEARQVEPYAPAILAIATPRAAGLTASGKPRIRGIEKSLGAPFFGASTQ
jgi:hypothetical protein